MELLFSRDVLAGRAAEAQAKPERLRAFAAPGGLGSVDLARVVEEQSELPASQACRHRQPDATPARMV